MYRSLAITVGLFLFVPFAQAGDIRPGTPLFGNHNKGLKLNPLRDAKYIKQYTGPVISCTNCFGYSRTQWRSWEQACNEPQPENPGPQQYPVSPMTAEPEKKDDADKKDKDKDDADKKDEKKDEKKDADKKDDKKEKEKEKGSRNIPAPMPLPAIVIPKVEVSVPSIPRPMPVRVAEPIAPTLIVPIPAK